MRNRLDVKKETQQIVLVHVVGLQSLESGWEYVNLLFRPLLRPDFLPGYRILLGHP